jgi:hypothetical protein
MTEGSRLLLHRPRQDYRNDPPAGLKKTDSREYGRSIVDFFVFYQNRENLQKAY